MSASREAPSTRSPRTGRRAGDSGTRAAILDAARRLFAERGYEAASLRAIAAQAGVDAALVVHFFGSKAGLLAEAIEWPFDPDVEIPRVLADGPERAGERLVALMVRTWDREGAGNPLITLLRASATEPRAAELMRELIQSRVFAPLLASLGVDRQAIRGELAASQLIGLGLARYVLRFEPLASARAAGVVAWVAPSVQRYLTGPLA
jgi:AcrR family transcriptional regulator